MVEPNDAERPTPTLPIKALRGGEMNEPKVIGLAGVGLQVPDLAVAESFYGAFGLTGEKRGSALGLRSPGRLADEIVVLPGAPQKRMHHISFIIRSGDEDAFDQKLRKAGLQTKSAPDGAPRGGLWFQDPWGTWINLNPGASPYQEKKENAGVEDEHEKSRVGASLIAIRARRASATCSCSRPIGKSLKHFSARRWACAPRTGPPARSPSWLQVTVSSITTALA